MSRRLPVLTLLALAAVTSPAPAQNGYGTLRESAEPPLATNPNADEIIRLAKAQQARPYVPAVRPIDTPAPAVTLRVNAPATLALNQDVDVRLIVENASRVAARNVAVIYNVPKDATLAKTVPPSQPDAAFPGCATWKIENLAAGGRQEFVLTVKPPPGVAELESKARVVVDQEQSVRTKFAKAELKVTKTGPIKALRFDILVFGITVTNPSDVELRDVTVTDKLPAGLVHRPDDDRDRANTLGPSRLTGGITDEGQTRTWKIDRLAPKESRRIEYYVAATAAAAAGVIPHQAFAQAAGGAQDTGTDKVELIEPKLELKVDAPPRKSANVPAAVRITLTNNSLRQLQNILVTDLLDPCKLESAAGGQQLPDRVQWIVPTLGPNQSKVFDLAVSKADGGIVRHKATAVYRGVSKDAEAQTEFEAVAALAYDFRGTPTTVEVNGEVVYEMTVRNTGSAAATNIRPTIELPPELTLVKAEPENKVEAGKVTFEPVPTLPPNGRATFRVTAKAAKASVGAVVKAELGGDPFPSGPIKRHEMTAIGGSSVGPSAPAPAGTVPLPVPVPPPPRP
jgi:uncharacterized repeat protein (TIGR01451 family)